MFWLVVLFFVLLTALVEAVVIWLGAIFSEHTVLLDIDVFAVISEFCWFVVVAYIFGMNNDTAKSSNIVSNKCRFMFILPPFSAMSDNNFGVPTILLVVFKII